MATAAAAALRRSPPKRSARSGGEPAGLAERWRRRRERHGVPEGIRITKVGLWFVLFTVVVAVAATNTGNNALYLVLACMLALLVVSGVVSRWNLRRLAVRLEPPGDVYARRPYQIAFTITNRSRRLARWLLLFGVTPKGPARLVPHLPAGASARGALELIFPRRGRQRIEAAHFSSLFPLGLFRKGMRYSLGLEVLVFPELFAPGTLHSQPAGLAGESSSGRQGWGHELHALRGFRAGDDPRGIHWKKSAQTGNLVYTERESEESRRLSILLDNASPAGAGEDSRERFERLVSEAATLAVDHLARGFEVELVTRDGLLPFASGTRQRRAILECLALVELKTRRSGELRSGDPRARTIRLSFGEATL